MFSEQQLDSLFMSQGICGDAALYSSSYALLVFELPKIALGLFALIKLSLMVKLGVVRTLSLWMSYVMSLRMIDAWQ